MGFSIGSAGGGMGGPRGMIGRFGDKVEGKTFDPSIVLRLLRYVRPYWWQMIVAFIAMIVVSVLTLVIPYLVKVAIDQPIAQGDQDGLNQIALLMLAAFAGLFVASMVQRYLLSWATMTRTSLVSRSRGSSVMWPSSTNSYLRDW